MAKRGGLVYSTERGEMCPRCRQPKARCTCRNTPGPPANDGIVRVWRQTKGRKGKGVTLIKGLALPPAELTALAGQLKKLCGSGGTAKDGAIEIQGDHRDKILDELRRRGYTAKKAGG